MHRSFIVMTLGASRGSWWYMIFFLQGYFPQAWCQHSPSTSGSWSWFSDLLTLNSTSKKSPGPSDQCTGWFTCSGVISIPQIAPSEWNVSFNSKL